MKKILILVAFLIAFMGIPQSVQADTSGGLDLFPEKSENGELERVIEEQADSLNLSDFDKFLNDDSGVFQGGFSGIVASLTKGEFFTDGQTSRGIADVFFGEVKSVLPNFIYLVGVTILISVLSGFTADFLKADMKNLLSFALAIVVIVVISPMILDVANGAKSGIETLSGQAEMAFPILITLVFALGGNSSATCFSPLLYTLSNVIITLVSSWVFPMFMFLLGVTFINSLSKNINFSGICDFVLSVSKYLLGITFTVFSASMALGGISAGSFDSVSYRTAKYAISNSVPVIGTYVRDGFDLILFSGVLLKNAVGVGFVVLAFITLLAPVTKLVCVILMLKLTSAITQPFASKEIVGLFTGVAKGLSLIVTAYIAVFFMYSVAIIMLMISTNILF